MMRGTIKASWRRVIQTAKYESEELLLSVEMDGEDNMSGHVLGAAELSRALSAQGDQLLLERLANRESAPPEEAAPIANKRDHSLPPPDAPEVRKFFGKPPEGQLKSAPIEKDEYLS